MAVVESVDMTRLKERGLVDRNDVCFGMNIATLSDEMYLKACFSFKQPDTCAVAGLLFVHEIWSTRNGWW